MYRIFKLKLPKTENLFGVVEIMDLQSREAAMNCFSLLYNGIGEDYFVEMWNNFVFCVPARDCIYVLQDRNF